MLVKEEGKTVSRLGILWASSKDSPYRKECEEIKGELIENNLLLLDIESESVSKPIFELGGAEYRGKDEIEQLIDWLKKERVS